MGLLDDAIREHLALKRRHGADPSEVAREEHDALGPIEFGQDAGDASPSPVDGEPLQGRVAADSAHAPHADVFPETAEIDMREIFDADSRDRTSWMTAADEDLSAWDQPVRARRLERTFVPDAGFGGEVSAKGSFS